MFDQSTEAILLVRDSIIDCNATAGELFGRSREDIIGKTPSDLAPSLQYGDQDTRRLQQTLWEKVNAGEPQRFAWEYLRADGTVGEIDVRLKAIDIEGRPAILASGRDITEQKRTERELRESEERYRLAQHLARTGSWMWDLVTDEVFWSDEILAMFGVSPDEFDGKPGSLRRVVHPEDVDLWRENVRACIEEGKEHRIDFRIVRPDGMIRWVGAYGNTVRDDNGKPVQMLGVVIDITDRKTMENELRESEELYRRFFDSSPYALFIGGPFILNKPNPSAVRMFGASSEEMRLSRPEDFSPQFQPDGMLSSEKAAFYIEEALDGRPQFFEWRSRRKDGTEFDSEVSLIRVDRHGEPQLMTTIKDITERKKAEESLIASLHEKETLLQEIYHRTKNNMQVIASLLNLQASSSDSPEVVGIIEDSTNRIRTMALAHEKLYRGGNLSRINMKEYITELARLMLSGSESVSDRVNLRFDLQEIEMLIDLAVPCGLIINELLTNSLKHAFPQGRKGWIRLGLKSIGKNALELEVQDNGIGLPADFDVSDAPTLGIQLVRRIALHQLHGDISARVDNGLCWCIRFRNDLYTERVKE